MADAEETRKALGENAWNATHNSRLDEQLWHLFQSRNVFLETEGTGNKVKERAIQVQLFVL